ncbi:MAG: putative pre-16S rRNA nuclease [Chitinophagales bacterium]|nr:MAG: putative pre-16S rRNA nuclease [Chitinophagales bacterium]
MGRIIAIDVGLKRTGLAVTDPQQIIATPLTALATEEVIPFLKKYVVRESVECFVVGEPRGLDDQPTHATAIVGAFVRQLQNHFPHIPVASVDERFTSKMAMQTLIQANYKKKDRRVKQNIDKVSAVLILQAYLEQKQS